jgi:hypothetical protein
MATKKPAAKQSSKAASKPASKAPAKSRGLTKPIPATQHSKQEVDATEQYTPQFAGKNFMQRAQSQTL